MRKPYIRTVRRTAVDAMESPMAKRTDPLPFGWRNDRVQQELDLSILSWDYKVFVESFQSHRTHFGFEGIVSEKEEGLKNLKVIGEIEVPIEVQCPDDEDTPLDNRGFIHLVSEEGIDPFLGVTLYCSKDAYYELFRVFSSAFANVGAIALILYLRKPEAATNEFWQTAWREERIAISHYLICTGGYRPKQSWIEKVFSSS